MGKMRNNAFSNSPAATSPMVSLTTSPNLSLVEANALAAMLGRPSQAFGLRNYPATGPWLDGRFGGDAVGAIDALVGRLDHAVAGGGNAIAALEFSGEESFLFDAAMVRALKCEIAPSKFLAEFAVDRKRVAHLHIALRRDLAASHALLAAPFGEQRDQARRCLMTARVLRRDRAMCYVGARSLVLAPEMQLYSDVINVAHGRYALSVLRGDPEQARAMYADDLRRAAPEPPTLAR